MAYVYAIVVDDVVRYIGKGSAKSGHLSRFHDHMRAMRRFIRVKAEGVYNAPMPKFSSTIVVQLAHEWLDGAMITEMIIADRLTDGAAFKREQKEIARYGKQLWNRPSPFNKGYEMKPNHRDKLSVSAKARHKRNPEALKSMSVKGARARWGNNVVKLKP